MVLFRCFFLSYHSYVLFVCELTLYCPKVGRIKNSFKPEASAHFCHNRRVQKNEAPILQRNISASL